MAEKTTLTPPDNFAMVLPFIYRSGMPKSKHHAFLKHLGLRSLLTLIREPYPEHNSLFLREQGVKFFQFGVAGNKVYMSFQQLHIN